MTLKKKIYKRLSVFGFKKGGKGSNVYIKHIQDNYYLVMRVEKIFDSDMLKEPEAIGKEYRKKSDLPHSYDIMLEVCEIEHFDTSSPLYFDKLCSLQQITETPIRNWTKWNDGCEDFIADNIALKFKEHCIDNFLEKKKEDRSIFDFVIHNYKKTKPYPWFFQLLRMSELAYYDNKIKETWFWYEKAVDNYYRCYIFHRYEKYMPSKAGIYDLFNSETFNIDDAKKVSFEKLEEIKNSKIMPEREIGYFLDFRKIIEQGNTQSADDSLPMDEN